MKVLGIDFVACSAAEGDLKEMVRYYRETLGISEELVPCDCGDAWMEFDTKPVALALAPWHEPGRMAIALAVEDVAEAIDELRSKGVKVVLEPHDFGACTMGMIEDPWGHLFILHRRKEGTVG